MGIWRFNMIGEYLRYTSALDTVPIRRRFSADARPMTNPVYMCSFE